MAPARIDRVATVAQKLNAADWPALESAYNALEGSAKRVIEATLAGAPEVAVERAADLRFVGQGFEVVTVLPAGPYEAAAAQPIREAFEAAYRKVFGLVPPVGEGRDHQHPRRRHGRGSERRAEGAGRRGRQPD